MPADFQHIFDKLRAILVKHAGGKLSVTNDSDTHYCLTGGVHPTRKGAMPLAWVKIDKNYVSYHFMPIYMNPKLATTISKPLKARMQGKSCFNFKAVDDALFEELDRLTSAGFAAFSKTPYMPGGQPKSTR
jgi:hypothetical protein